MPPRNRPPERTEINGGRRHGRHHRGICGNCVDYDGNVERLAQQNAVLMAELANMRERNATLTTERTNANHQLNTLTERLNNAQMAAIETQDERLALREQLKESEDARAILQSKIETLQPELYKAREALQDVDTALERMILDLRADNTRLRGQNEALEADNTRLRGQNEALEADNTRLGGQNETLAANNTRLKGQNEALAADDAQLKGQLSTCEELLLATQLERKKLQETARKEGTTQHAINSVYITPPTTPEVLYTIPRAIPGQFPVDDNTRPDEQIIAEECAKYNVTNSLSTPEVGTTNQRQTFTRRNHFSRISP